MSERGILFTPENYGKVEDGSKTMTRRIMKPQPKWIQIGKTPVPERGVFRTGQHGVLFVDDERSVLNIGVLDEVGHFIKCPYGTVGDRLYVKEAFTYWENNEEWKPKKRERFEWLSAKQQAEIIEQQSKLGHDYLVYKRDGVKRSLAEWKYPHPIYDHCIGRFGKTISPIFMPKWAARLWLELIDVRVERLCDCSSEDAIAEGADDWAGECALREKRLTKPQLQYAALWDSINGEGSWDLNPWVWVLTFKKVQP